MELEVRQPFLEGGERQQEDRALARALTFVALVSVLVAWLAYRAVWGKLMEPMDFVADLAVVAQSAFVLRGTN